MSNVIDLSQAQSVGEVNTPYHVNATGAGARRGEVSSQWFSRPDDQKFLNLDDLYGFTKASADASFYDIVDVRDIEVRADADTPEDLRLMVPRKKSGDCIEMIETVPNHWSFGQICSLVQVPAGYMRRLPGAIAGINLQYGLSNFRSEAVKTYATQNGKVELRAATGPDYGRIFDHEVVDAVRRVAGRGDGSGGFHWKVPGVMNWADGTYNPNAPITRESTTLFASDRDVFLFLVDDRHPIKIGTYTDSQGRVHDDLIYRGFYTFNSEVGSQRFGLATFYLRGVCQNRCLWGVEGFSELSFRHSKGAPGRFMAEARPALEQFSNANEQALLQGIKQARDAVVAKNDDDAKEFLGKRGFSKSQAESIVKTVLAEEGRPARSIWDMVQGITAVARKEGHQDARLDMERQAGKLLDKVA